MSILYIILALAVSGILYMRLEAGSVEVTRVRYSMNPKALRVLQLSDIHINFMFVPVHKIRKIIKRENPDIVIMTGDYILKAKHAPRFLNFIREIKGNETIYLCLGNHDYEAYENDPKGLEEFIKAITDMGVKVLHNSSARIQKNTKNYNIIGIEDIRYDLHDVDKAFASAPQDVYANIVFTHNPDLVFDLPKNKVYYLMAGHFHGGQIWAPFNIEFALLRNEKLCKMGITRGAHVINGVKLYINRGLGNVCLPLRFLSRPEITVFYIP